MCNRKTTRVLFAALLPLSVQAAPNMQPGLWEITTKSEMAGMPANMPAQTMRHCYRAEDIKDNKPVVPPQKDCKMDDMKESGNTVTWKVSCKSQGGPMSGQGKVTYAGQSYTGTMQMTGKMEGMAINMNMNFSGKRVGDCK